MRRRTASLIAAAAGGYAGLQWLGRTYGATRAERRRPLPGDGLCADPHIVTTHAITIDAPPEHVWPWLVQMGWGRGQWYTARWVDRLLFPNNGPSADVLVPELQRLAVGDRILDGPPEAECSFVVDDLEPARHLVLHSTEHLPPGWADRFGAGIDWTWAFVLDPVNGGRTRFLFRTRARLRPWWVTASYWTVIVPADFIMSRQMLRGVKQRAERTTRQTSSGWRPGHPSRRPRTSSAGRSPRAERINPSGRWAGADRRVRLMRPGRLTLGELANVWVDEPAAPFHIALAGEFDGTPFLREDGSLDLERVRAELVRRVDRVPVLRRRVVWTRLGQGRPYWADDPAFDAARHVTVGCLPDRETFDDWCAQAILRPLDRSRPLWRAEVVSGLPGGRFGVLIVVHHVVAGGLAGVALAAALLDTAPGESAARPVAAADAAQPPSAVPAAAVPQRGLPERVRRRGRQLADAAADFRTRAPVTSLSHPVGPGRRLATVRLPLEQLREAGHRLGVTVNDLLLAAITGGLRELLVSRGDDIGGLVLRASVPVGARTAGQPDGMLLLGLPVGEADPLRRLAAIHRASTVLKARLRAGGGDVLDVLQLPLPAARVAVRWMRRIAGGRINLFVTNVPGPEQPLWLAGARLLEAVPVAPLAHGVPLGVAALSYAGTLCVGINADAAVDDVGVLAAGVQRSATGLVEAARSGVRLPTVPAGGENPRAARRVIENDVVVDRDPAAVFAFMTDPRQELDWNPQLLAVEQLTDGPIGVGTRFRMRFGHGVGDSTVTYTGFDPPRSWTAHSTSPRLDVHADGRVEAAGSGARLVVRTDLRPHGPLRPLAPLLRCYMHRTWDRNLATVRARLQQPAAPAAARSEAGSEPVHRP